MNCKEFERNVPVFINKKMDFVMMKQFVEHLHSCPGCKEELNIQYLIDEGLVRLEDGKAFDLQKEMIALIKESEKKIQYHDRHLRAGRRLEWVVFLLIAAIVLLIILV